MLACSAVACSPDLPDPETPAAQLYVNRCNGCHRVFAPRSLTAAMWDMQVERMQGEMVRRGLPPLTKAERGTVLAYLHRHSADARPTEVPQ
jgi:hypothetical protein